MAHIIVVGNEKGGSGKSTTCMHVATALARMGHRVGALDLDLRQKTFGRYVENRRAFLARSGLALATPEEVWHAVLPQAPLTSVRRALTHLLPPGRWDVRCNRWGLVFYPAEQTRSGREVA